MTKQEYERVRQEISKKYKDQIQELKAENLRLKEMIIEERKENDKLKSELSSVKQKLESPLGRNPLIQNFFNTYSDMMNNL